MDQRSAGDSSQLNPSTNDPGDPGVVGDIEVSVGAKKALSSKVEERSLERPEIPYRPDILLLYWTRDEVYTEEEKAKCWSDAAEIVRRYSDEIIERWKKDIDTYLLVAGLISAILTAFNVPTYLLLQQDPISILQQISGKLDKLPVDTFTSAHSLDADGTDASTPPPVPRWAIWLNSLWFSGLVFSLTSASLGITVKQTWLNEYHTGLFGASRPIARVRQYRWHNLRAWRVGEIVGTIPMLLQLALAFFLSGLLVLLWDLSSPVAEITSALVGVLATFTITTTLLPLFIAGCAYLSPQARIINYLLRLSWIGISRRILGTPFSVARRAIGTDRHRRDVGLPGPPNSTSAPVPGRSHIARTGSTVVSLAKGIVGKIQRYIQAGKDPNLTPTWQGRERSAVDEVASNLDVHILVEAYMSTLHADALSTASVCLLDLRDDRVLDYFRQLYKFATDHFGPTARSQNGPFGLGTQQRLLWLHVLLCVLMGRSTPLSQEEETALVVYFANGSWSSSMKAGDTAWAIDAIDAIFEQLCSAEPWACGAPRLQGINEDVLRQGRRYLLHNALRCNRDFSDCITRGIEGAYRQFRLSEAAFLETPSETSKASLSKHLGCIDHFLDCANEALEASLSLSPSNLEVIRAYTQDVLTETTRTLLQVFAEDQTQLLQAVVGARALYGVLLRLGELVSDSILRCIPDALIPAVLRLADALEISYDYDENYWGVNIPGIARDFKAKVVRIKVEPPKQTSSRTPPAKPGSMEAAVPAAQEASSGDREDAGSSPSGDSTSPLAAT